MSSFRLKLEGNTYLRPWNVSCGCRPTPSPSFWPAAEATTFGFGPWPMSILALHVAIQRQEENLKSVKIILPKF